MAYFSGISGTSREGFQRRHIRVFSFDGFLGGGAVMNTSHHLGSYEGTSNQKRDNSYNPIFSVYTVQ